MIETAASRHSAWAPPSELEPQRQELAVLIARVAHSPGAFDTALPRLRCVRREQPTALCGAFYEPALSVVAQGAKRLLVAGHSYTYDESRYLVTSVDLPATSSVTQASPERPFLAVSLRLDLQLVAELMCRVEVASVPPTHTQRGLGISPIDASLLDAMLRLLRLLDAPRDIPVLAPLIEREIHYRLLTGEQASRLRNLAAQDSQAHQVTKAIAWLKANFAAPLYVEELAKIANMSQSSLHHHFKMVTGMSPLQYQKRLRLQEARNWMVTGMDAASAGHRVGYESPSHFNRDYRRLFGISPGKDRFRPPSPPVAAAARSRLRAASLCGRPPWEVTS